MSARAPVRLKLVVDTREQQPWIFPDEFAQVRRGTLKSGDYALDGDDVFAIERKSLDDFLGTISSGWERFARELARMSGQRRIVIVEGTAQQIVSGDHNHSRLSARFIFRRIAELTMAGVCVLLMGSPVIAAVMAYSILKDRWRELYGDDRRDGRSCAAGQGLALSDARQPVDDLANCPRGIAEKNRRERRDQIRTATR